MAAADTRQLFRDVSPQVDVDALEREVLAYWEGERIFQRSLEARQDAEQFTFYDGPPYATGKPHYGHILQSALKDTVLRYKTMRGYFVPRRVGWDCHGLPVETLVEKELGFGSKKDIEAYGIEQFNQRCREMVTRYIDEFTAILKRVGRWASYDEPYFTMDRDYMETEWGVFKQLWDKQLVYPAFRTTPYCVRCETPLSNFEVNMAYKDKVDTAVYVMIKVDPDVLTNESRESNESLWLLVWTTTPWTLPGNAAVAFNPNLEYVSVEHGGREFIVAKQLTGKIFGEEVKPGKLWSSEELRGISYEPLYQLGDIRETHERENVFRLLESDHVTADDGTGLVHIAPAFGEEDAELGRRYSLPILRTVTPEGRMAEDVDGLAGEHIFEANGNIVDDLEKRKILFKQEQYKHSYPFCWRCDTPLIYYALDSWFVRVSDLKQRMLELNQQIHWMPKHVQAGRFGNGIESAPDWAVSRNRYWSVPIPIWQCDTCGEKVCVGSRKELEKLAGVEEINDLHRPYVDEIRWSCEKCKGNMTRVPEVLDVWFDSGSMPYTQENFPADFIVESIEQTRAWFYTMHVLATALKDQVAFKHVIASGLIFAEDGQKLSKKLKNYPEPEPTIRTYGADALRLYLLSSTTLGEPYRFSEKELRQLQRHYRTLWNVYSFFVRYANTTQNLQFEHQNFNDGARATHVLDRWVIARLKQLEADVLRDMETYQIDRAARAFLPFIDDVSNWYVRRSRARFQPAKAAHTIPSEDAFLTLHLVLVRAAKMLAPFMPFVAEEMYRNLTGGDSVHLTDLDDPPAVSQEEAQLLQRMAQARAIVSAGLALRAQAGIKVRQPLAQLAVVGEALSRELVDIVQDEVNVQHVLFAAALPEGSEWVRSLSGSARSAEEQAGTDAGQHVALLTTITPELAREGLAREIIRHGQSLRREADLALDQRITLLFVTEDAELHAALEAHQDEILRALQADAVVDHGEAAAERDVHINKRAARLGIVR